MLGIMDEVSIVLIFTILIRLIINDVFIEKMCTKASLVWKWGDVYGCANIPIRLIS